MDIETTKKPWGLFARFTSNEPSTVKLLYINKGEELSLQYHTHREEFWRIVHGNPRIIIGETVNNPHEGEDFTVAPHTIHQISAPVDNVIILEISKGQFDENDIVRIEDKYNREKVQV
jgi:mannose-6-phosphate isomerase-like protein (cupin superfamily)